MVVHAGEPILVSAFEGAYREDPIQATRDLTDHLEERLRTLMVDIPREIDEKKMRQIELIQQNEYGGDLLEAYHRSRKLVVHLRRMLTQNENIFFKFSQEVTDYFEKITAEGVKDRDIKMSQKINYYNILKYVLWLIIEFPVFVFGLLNNLLAAGIPLLVIRIVKPYIGYYTTFKVLIGMLSFPLFYYLQTRWLMSYLHESGWLIAVFYLLLTFSSLYRIIPYIERFQGLMSALRINGLKRNSPEKIAGLREERESILAQLL